MTEYTVYSSADGLLTRGFALQVVGQSDRKSGSGTAGEFLVAGSVALGYGL